MRTSILTSAASALLLATATTAQYTNQSAPFHLIVLSENSTVNGSTLFACHEGAAIEGLCLGSKEIVDTTTVYNFNTTTNEGLVFNATIGEPGYLTYELRGGNFNVSEPVQLSYDPTSNVAVPLFSPSESGTSVAFDEDDLLNIQGYVDDTTNPASIGGPYAYYRWYVCTTYEGYTYTTLAWALGNGSPENPTCVSVNVTRSYEGL
jgi:hypothetical protein